MAKLDSVTLAARQVIYEPDGPIDYVYFPLGGIVSLVVQTEGVTVEVATVGKEGMVGTPVVLETDTSPHRALVQVGGEYLRVKTVSFKDELRRSPPLYALVHRYTQALVDQISQTAVCNRAHAIEQRLCRWLLMSHDGVGSDDLSLTQEFIAQMLGVRRSSVNVVAGMLQKRGLIGYSRGRITILNRKGMEDCSCECYGVVRRRYNRVLAIR